MPRFLFICLIAFQMPHPTVFADSDAQTPARKYSMTISGGVSLGIYEAGVNWAIIEAIKGSGKHTLQSVTGASAGAVNTVLTGLRYCEAETSGNRSAINNLFYRTWNVQLADLLPGRDNYGVLELQGQGLKNDSGILEDSIFSRGVYVERLLEISQAVKNGQYKNGCEVDIAIVVTRVEPAFSEFGTGDAKLQVPNQRYVLPLTLSVQGDTPVTTGIAFKNNLRYAKFQQRSSSYLYLPEENGIVPFDTVARAVMASSAFPIVFGSVEMGYCAPITPVADNLNDANCPAGHYLASNTFIDGGVFDNVPVGAAVDLVKARDASDGIETSHSYIFLNPENDQAVSLPDTNVRLTDGRTENDYTNDYTIEHQLEVLSPLLTTLRKQVLADSLAKNFGSVDAPQLLLTRRTLPIVGTYLQKFGAFFDKSFFYHDYAAGIFDGINSVVEFFCADAMRLEINSQCENGAKTLQLELLSTIVFEPLKNSADAIDSRNCSEDSCDAEILVKLMQAFYQRNPLGVSESVGNCYPDGDFLRASADGYVNQTLSVFLALCGERFGRFEDLILALDIQRTDNSGVFKKRKWTYSDEVEFILGKRLSPWTFGFLEKSLQRLLDLETKYNGKSASTFSAAWAMMPGSGSSQTVLERSRVLAHLSPDYIGIDGLQSGVAISWDWALPLPEFNCHAFARTPILSSYCTNHRFMVGVGTQFRRVVNERDRFNTSSVFIGVDFSKPESFLRSSSGVRFVRNADYFPFVDLDTNYESYSSIEVYSRFFGNKIEVSLGFEGDSLSLAQDDLSLKIGLYDVDRFLALMCPSCF